jgi:cytochrome P450
MTIVYDPSDPEQRRNPYPVFAHLRAHEPIHWSPSLKSWIVTSYEDVKRVALSGDMSIDRLGPFFKVLPSAAQQQMADVIKYLGLWVAFRDPPEHTRLRRLLNTTFNPPALLKLRPAVERVVAELIVELHPSDAIDLVADLAAPLPGRVIMDMLGIPRAKFSEIKSWSDDLAVFIGSARGVPDKYERARAGMEGMAAFFRAEIQSRRQSPQEDIISRLVAARDQDDRLSEDELIATCILVLFAGHETTTNAIASAVYYLLRHPEQLARLRSGSVPLTTAIEECLRFDGPTNAVCRLVGRDHEFHGRQLKAGERVFALVNAANRDPRVFRDADQFDLGREPNPHLTFGQGIHFCIGAPLARIETQATVAALLAHFPDLALADAAPLWRDSVIMRGLERCRIALR